MTMAVTEEFDPELPVIEAMRDGDAYAFEEFLRRHHRWVRGIVYGVLGQRGEIEDVAQQVWTSIWQRISELREVKRWKPWMYRIARNTALDAGRARKRRAEQMRSLSLKAAAEDGKDSQVDPLFAAEQHAEVLEAIQSLPVLYREPFVLKHVNGWSYKEIADAMDMPVDSVETRLVRARRFLREALKEKLG